MLLALGEIQREALLENLGSGLKHVRYILEIRHHGRPALLLKMLIVNEVLAGPGLLPREDAALLGELRTRDQCSVGRGHRERTVDLIDEIDI